jgi:hypothetical protein
MVRPEALVPSDHTLVHLRGLPENLYETGKDVVMLHGLAPDYLCRIRRRSLHQISTERP